MRIQVTYYMQNLKSNAFLYASILSDAKIKVDQKENQKCLILWRVAWLETGVKDFVLFIP